MLKRGHTLLPRLERCPARGLGGFDGCIPPLLGAILRLVPPAVKVTLEPLKKLKVVLVLGPCQFVNVDVLEMEMVRSLASNLGSSFTFLIPAAAKAFWRSLKF